MRVSALTIGGFDPTGTVGVPVDLRTFAAAGVHGLCVLTLTTAQNTVVFGGVAPLASEAVSEQLDALLSDVTPAATKTGMLWSPDIAEAVAAEVRSRGLANLVVDPVLVSGSGERIIDAAIDEIYLRQLLPVAAVVTPNRDEAALLLAGPIVTDDDALSAAVALRELGPDVVVVTGSGAAGDVVATAAGASLVARPQIGEDPVRGSGDTLSAAVAACLAMGASAEEAVRTAIEFAERSIRRGVSSPIGSGRPSAAQAAEDWPVG